MAKGDSSRSRVEFILDFTIKDEAIKKAKKQVDSIGRDLDNNLARGGNAGLPGVEKRLGAQSRGLKGLYNSLVNDRTLIGDDLRHLRNERKKQGFSTVDQEAKIKQLANSYRLLGQQLKEIDKVYESIDKHTNKITKRNMMSATGSNPSVMQALSRLKSLEAEVKTGISTRSIDPSKVKEYDTLFNYLNSSAMRGRISSSIGNDKKYFHDPLTGKRAKRLSPEEYQRLQSFVGRDENSAMLGHTRLMQSVNSTRQAGFDANRQRRYQGLLQGLHGRVGTVGVGNVREFEEKFHVYRAGSKVGSDPAFVSMLREMQEAIRVAKRASNVSGANPDRRRARYAGLVDNLHSNIGNIDTMDADDLDKLDRRVRRSVKFGGLGDDINSDRQISALKSRIRTRRDMLRTGSKPIRRDLTGDLDTFFDSADDDYFGGIRNMRQLRKEQRRVNNLRKFSNLADPDRNTRSLEFSGRLRDRQEEIQEGLARRKEIRNTVIKDGALQTLGMTKYTLGGLMGGLGGGTAYAVNQASQAEGQKIVLSGLVNTYGRFTDSSGKQVDNLKNFQASQMYSQSLYEQLRKQAVESPLTTAQMFEFFMAGGPTLMGAGTKTPNAIKVVDKMASLGKAMNLADRDIEQDIRATAMGDLRSTNKIGKLLGFNTKEVQTALAADRKDPNGQAFYKLFQEKTAQIDMALGKFKDSFSAIWSNFTDSIEQLAIKLGTKIIPKLKPAIENLTKLVDDWASNGKLDQFARSLGDMLKGLGNTVFSLAKNLAPLLSTIEGLLLTTFIGIMANFAVRVAMQSKIAGASVGGFLSVLGLLVGGIMLYKQKLESESKSAFETSKSNILGSNLDALDSLKSKGAAYNTVAALMGTSDPKVESKLLGPQRSIDMMMKNATEMNSASSANNQGDIVYGQMTAQRKQALLDLQKQRPLTSTETSELKDLQNPKGDWASGLMGFIVKDAQVKGEQDYSTTTGSAGSVYKRGVPSYIEKELREKYKIKGDLMTWVKSNRGNKSLQAELAKMGQDANTLAKQMIDGPGVTVPVGAVDQATKVPRGVQRKNVSAPFDYMLSVLGRNQNLIKYRMDSAAVDASIGGSNVKLDQLAKLTASQVEGATTTRNRDIALATEQGLGQETINKINQDYSATVEEIIRKNREQAKSIHENIQALQEQNRQLNEQIRLTKLANQTASAQFGVTMAGQLQGPGSYSARVQATATLYKAQKAELDAKYDDMLAGNSYDLRKERSKGNAPNSFASALPGNVLAPSPATLVDSSTGKVVGKATDSLKYNSGSVKPEFKSALMSFLAAANSQGKGKVGIMGREGAYGYRTREQQAILFAAAVKKYGSVAKARKWVAPPDGSEHNWGLAADLTYSGKGLKNWAHANASKYGLQFRMGHEGWHVSLANQKGSISPTGNSETLPAINGTGGSPLTDLSYSNGDLDTNWYGGSRVSGLATSGVMLENQKILGQKEGEEKALLNQKRLANIENLKYGISQGLGRYGERMSRYALKSNPNRGLDSDLQLKALDNQIAQTRNSERLNNAVSSGDVKGIAGYSIQAVMLQKQAVDIQNAITNFTNKLQYLSEVMSSVMSTMQAGITRDIGRRQRGLETPFPYADQRYANTMSDALEDSDIKHDRMRNRMRLQVLGDKSLTQGQRDEKLQAIDFYVEQSRLAGRQRVSNADTPEKRLLENIAGSRERGRDDVSLQLLNNPSMLSNPLAMISGVYSGGINMMNQNNLSAFFKNKNARTTPGKNGKTYNVGQTLVGQLAGNFLGSWGVGQIMPNSNPEAVGMGSTLGTGLAASGVLGSALAGPLGIVAAGIGGGLLGGLFGGSKPDPEEERRRQALEQHQKNVEELLSSIDKGINIGNSYMRNVMTSGFYGNAGLWQSGRAYNRLAVQGYIGA
jgi:hypothetical protein